MTLFSSEYSEIPRFVIPLFPWDAALPQLQEAALLSVLTLEAVHHRAALAATSKTGES